MARFPRGRRQRAMPRPGPSSHPLQNDESRSLMLEAARKRTHDWLMKGPYESEGSNKLSDESDSESSTCESVSGYTRIKYDLQPSRRLWHLVWETYQLLMPYPDTPKNRYLLFLQEVDQLYQVHEKGVRNYSDKYWILTTLEFFPDTNFWNHKKNQVVERGPNDCFEDFVKHMKSYVRRYMYEGE